MCIMRKIIYLRFCSDRPLSTGRVLLRPSTCIQVPLHSGRTTWSQHWPLWRLERDHCILKILADSTDQELVKFTIMNIRCKMSTVRLKTYVLKK